MLACVYISLQRIPISVCQYTFAYVNMCTHSLTYTFASICQPRTHALAGALVESEAIIYREEDGEEVVYVKMVTGTFYVGVTGFKSGGETFSQVQGSVECTCMCMRMVCICVSVHVWYYVGLQLSICMPTYVIAYVRVM